MTHAGRGTGPATIHCLIDNTKLEPGSKHVSLKVEPGSEPKALQLDPRVGSRPATTPAPSPAPATASPAASWHALGTPPEELQLEFTLPTGQSFRWRRSGAGAGGAGAGGGPAEAGAEPAAAEEVEFTGVVGERVVGLGGGLGGAGVVRGGDMGCTGGGPGWRSVQGVHGGGAWGVQGGGQGCTGGVGGDMGGIWEGSRAARRGDGFSQAVGSEGSGWGAVRVGRSGYGGSWW